MDYKDKAPFTLIQSKVFVFRNASQDLNMFPFPQLSQWRHTKILKCFDEHFFSKLKINFGYHSYMKRSPLSTFSECLVKILGLLKNIFSFILIICEAFYRNRHTKLLKGYFSHTGCLKQFGTKNGAVWTTSKWWVPWKVFSFWYWTF